ncbi:MAG: CusA/CzcA family heavy metal efflux RND transporter [Chitinophagaceae bacterium]|jgi:cobalt-zinc-cadmium resistance protein CzcA|nr:CusA/CzcA family heavy metal efflux RND transporter [Chitinophagaceae bacterium]
MLNAIIQFSIRNKLIVGLMVIGLVIWGALDITRLPIDAVPDITNNQVLIITTAPNLGAPDVERFITAPIEQVTRNVQGIQEQRSFSRFGLSLVTIVFDDATDVYWARNQISERLTQARQMIPEGMGTPELGPVSTGLGEIFQYVVKPKPGYEGKFDLKELRTIQDWIVRRQLLGTPGVADVSSFGGALKQYEVAVNTDKLRSLQVTIGDVFEALRRNNQNTGGAYIEKGPTVLFIRTEGLVKSLEDIGSIVVKRVNGGIPVLVRDVADVRMGEAIRFGSMVYNTEGEVAGAVVMMLKGENSNKVIRNIKDKIKSIEKSLPEGVMIEAFLDRTKMVNNAIGTVEKNLMEGALIVIFVLVLFLGNFRAGFIVASVIPLSMLFAVIMMNIFHVSGNLMSLGALDFGLLVDGAVIIVEAVMHRMSMTNGWLKGSRLSQQEMNQVVGQASGKMMNAAVFGQIIILIVYLPILTLRGIEGKMFGPMAQTVSFAIIGAFLLSLTYVPMMSALMLSKKIGHDKNLSDRMMDKIQQLYAPLLKKAIAGPKWIIGTSVLVFALALWVLTTLGGEFIPKLEEGDFAVDTRALSGSSLTHTIDVTQKTSKILLDKFPEVQKVVTKIGSGEIPTDPMPMDAADMMVILKDKKEWKSAKTFDELAEKMSVALQDVPGASTGFQFPVQMRFNELMTGARQDVVCKIFGEDLDSLASFAAQLGTIVNTVEGARDLYVETVTGIPQMVVNYKREAIARYGASISDINNAVQSAYAGAGAGVVFEGDRRFDLVVRLNQEQKQNIANIQNLMVGLPDGHQVPLNVLADIQLQDGPYQIQREDAQRRITIGFNVRGRDVQTIVEELQQKVVKQMKFPSGYYITYGGQFENLQHATRRLSIAVPAALLLIFLMLFFAFHKLRYCLLIFSAIPLSAIGGVFGLWIRDMPFSISAGVGFIALFGVAVLNGIVLITEMNRLRTETPDMSIRDVILQATETRLRPVLMTASVASLGFLPMALSNGAGAEVQRPLATVVIAGLLSATLLTLFVLPVLYMLFEKSKPVMPMKTAAVLILSLCSMSAMAQMPARKVKLDDLLQLAETQTATIRVHTLQEQYYAALQKTARDIPKTQLITELGNYNSFNFDSRISLLQSFPSGKLYQKQQSVLDAYFGTAQSQTAVQKAVVRKMVQELYTELQYRIAVKELLIRADSIYGNYQKIAALRFSKGESNLLEKTSLDNQAQQNKVMLDMNESDIRSAQLQLSVLLQINWLPEAQELLGADQKLYDTARISQHPSLQLQKQQEALASAETALIRARLKPDWTVGYNNQSLMGWMSYKDRTEKYFNAANRFSSATIGMAFPLFNKAGKAKVVAAQKQEEVAKAATDLTANTLRNQMERWLQQRGKFNEAVQYYRTNGLRQSEVIMVNANLNYRNGQINYIEWGALLTQALGIQAQYLEALRSRKLAEVELDYLLQNN